MKSGLQVQKMVDLYEETGNISKISKEVDATRKTIRKYLRKEGVYDKDIEIEKGNFKNSYRDDEVEYEKRNWKTDLAFRKLDQETKYWIGFLLADGSVGRYGNGQPSLTLALQKRDKNHLQKFKAFLNTDNSIIKDKDRYRIKIRSSEIAYDLSTYGVINNKSQGTEVRKLRDDRHFWRGVVDGDGSINIPGNLPRLTLYGCETVMNQFKDFCVPICEAETTVHNKTNNTYGYNLNGQYAIPILKELYIDQDIALERKERRAISHLTSHDYTS